MCSEDKINPYRKRSKERWSLKVKVWCKEGKYDEGKCSDQSTS